MNREARFVAAVQTAAYLSALRQPRLLTAGVRAVAIAAACPNEFVPVGGLASHALDLVRYVDMPTNYPLPGWLEVLLEYEGKSLDAFETDL